MIQLGYLRGAIGDERFFEEHGKAIRELLEVSYASGNLEKLRNHEVYSYRLSDAKRLLFTLRKVGGKDYLLILDYLPTHDYHKSKFLDSKLLKRHFEKHQQEYEACVAQEWSFEAVEGRLFAPEHVVAEEKEDPVWNVVDYYKEEFITLSPNQEQALKVKLPTIITGVAGSGKTCIGLTALQAYLNTYLKAFGEAQAREEKLLAPCLLFVTESPYLIEEMKRAWEALPLTKEYASCLQCKTYEDLLQEEHLKKEPLTEVRMVGFEVFEGWYEQYQKSKKTLSRTQNKKHVELKAKQVYQECRIACGYTKEKYQDLGRKQASLKTQEERLWVYKSYQDYLEYLAQKGKSEVAKKKKELKIPDLHKLRYLDPALSSLEQVDTYDMVVVDELQDFSHGQQQCLAKIPQSRRFLACRDSNQRLFDSLSDDYLLTGELGIPPEQRVQLGATHRCFYKAFLAANELRSFSLKLAAGTPDKNTPALLDRLPANELEGQIFLLSRKTLAQNAWIATMSQKANFAIITAEENIEAVKACFPNTPFVFTPKQSKGLEFDIVLIYELFSDTIFRQAQDRIARVSDKKQPLHQAKAGEEEHQFTSYFNSLYVAYTRAKKMLILCESKTRLNQSLFLKIQALAEKTEPNEANTCIQASENWDEACLLQWQAGRKNLALEIFQKKLSGKDEAGLRAFIEKKRKGETSSSRGEEQKSQAQPLPPQKQKAASVDKGKRKKGSSSSCLENEVSKENIQPKEKQKPTSLSFGQESTRQQAFAPLFWNKQKHSLAVLFSAAKSGDLNLVVDLWKRQPHQEEQSSALMIAAWEGHLEVVNFFLKQGVDPLKPGKNFDGQYYFALFAAARKGHARVVKKLWKHKKHDKEIATSALRTAALDGHDAVVDFLLRQGVDPLIPGQNDKAQYHSPLFMASQNGHILIVKRLWFHKKHDQETAASALMIASSEGHLDIVNFLLARGVRPIIPAKNADGQDLSALFVASEEGHVAIVKSLWKQEKHDEATAASALVVASRKGYFEVVHFLLEQKVDPLIPVKGPEGQDSFALFLASGQGHIDIVKKLWEYKTHDEKIAVSALLAASWEGNLEVVNFLLKQGVNPLIPVEGDENQSYFSLIVASQRGNAQIVESLWKHTKQDKETAASALMCAATEGQLEVVDFFLAQGVDPLIPGKEINGDYFTPLIVASERGHLQVVDRLWKHKKHDAQTAEAALLSASIEGHLELVNFFLEQGIDPLVPGKDTNGENYFSLVAASEWGHSQVVEKLWQHKKHEVEMLASALMRASCGGHLEVVNFFLERGGVDPLVQGKASNGIYYSPLVVASEKGHLEVAKKLWGHKPHGVDTAGSALISASSQGHFEMVNFLLSEGIDPIPHQDPEERCYSPLFFASQEGHAQIVERLWEYKKPDEDMAASALMIASSEGHLEVVAFLLKKGVDPCRAGIAADGTYYYPLSIATIEGQLVVVKFLLEQGANLENPEITNLLYTLAEKIKADDPLAENYKKIQSELEDYITQNKQTSIPN